MRSWPGSRGSPARVPLVPGRGEVGDQLRVVDLEQRLVRVWLGFDEPGLEHLANRGRARRGLGGRGGDADPDLLERLVEQAAIAPDDRHGELHAAT